MGRKVKNHCPKLSHVDFSFSQSKPFYKALDIEQKAISDRKSFGQEKIY